MDKIQCDGCQAKVPVDVHGNHQMSTSEGYIDLMACQAKKYEDPRKVVLAREIVAAIIKGHFTSPTYLKALELCELILSEP